MDPGSLLCNLGLCSLIIKHTRKAVHISLSNISSYVVLVKKEAPPKVKNYLHDLVETTLPVSIDRLLELRSLERRAMRTTVGKDEIRLTEEDEILEQLDQDRDAYIMDFMETWRNQAAVPPSVAATRTQRPDLVYPTRAFSGKRIERASRTRGDGTSKKRSYKSEKRREQRRREVKEIRLGQRDTKRKYREADKGRKYPRRDVDETYHQRELDEELDFSSGSSEAPSIRENTRSPWSRLSDYSDSSYDEGFKCFTNLYFLSKFHFN